MSFILRYPRATQPIPRLPSWKKNVWFCQTFLICLRVPTSFVHYTLDILSFSFVSTWHFDSSCTETHSPSAPFHPSHLRVNSVLARLPRKSGWVDWAFVGGKRAMRWNMKCVARVVCSVLSRREFDSVTWKHVKNTCFVWEQYLYVLLLFRPLPLSKRGSYADFAAG